MGSCEDRVVGQVGVRKMLGSKVDHVLEILLHGEVLVALHSDGQYMVIG